jgi:type VI secretion system protein ImpH
MSSEDLGSTMSDSPGLFVDTSGDTPKSLEGLEGLEARAPGIPFFSLVSHLARVVPGVIGGVVVADERVRFRHDTQLVFHANDISALKIVHTGDKIAVEVTTPFLGVIGSVSPLANYFSEDVLRDESQDDRTLRDFYDVFHHRLIAFVYLAHRRAEPWCEVRIDGDDRASARSLALAGRLPRPHSAPKPPGDLGDTLPPGARMDAPLRLRHELALARTFARSGSGRDRLEAALALAFPGVPMTLLDFLARDLLLARDSRTQLGVYNATLGRGARLGRHMPAQTGLLRVLVGPVDRETYEAFLPSGHEFPRLSQLVAALTGGMLDCEAEIEIRCGDEPRARLGAAHGSRLGATALVGRPRVDRAVRVRVPVNAGVSARAEFLAAAPPP